MFYTSYALSVVITEQWFFTYTLQEQQQVCQVKYHNVYFISWKAFRYSETICAHQDNLLICDIYNSCHGPFSPGTPMTTCCKFPDNVIGCFKTTQVAQTDHNVFLRPVYFSVKVPVNYHTLWGRTASLYFDKKSLFSLLAPWTYMWFVSHWQNTAL